MNIRGYRVSKGLTQEKAAEVIGRSRNNYLLKEKGDRKFSLEEAYKLSDKFDITLEEFYQATKE